ncbi:50S ribosomal protein L2 [uncultured archaeon]|nr:50S ribosomal protein L2 [uncultured archaeon]
MGRRLITQKRGKGGPVWIATRNGAAVSRYVDYEVTQAETIGGEIVELINDPARSAIIAKVMLDNGRQEEIIAAEGIYVGQRIQQGPQAVVEIGNVKMLADCQEGCPVFNIEKNPGDGGSLARSSGMYALILTKEKGIVYVKMPSGKIMQIRGGARATVGVAGGGGRKEKPFVRAGKKYWAMRARHKKYPIVRAIAKNALNHPFGGANHHPGKSKSTSRNAPPGRKVGDIASSRTGRRKKN